MTEQRQRPSTKRTPISGEPWYELAEGDPELPKRVFSDLLSIRGNWGSRYAKWDASEKLLGTTSQGASGYWNKALTYDGRNLEYSVVRSVRDALRARLGTRRSKPRAYTSGARYTVRERARLNTKMVKAIFSRANVYKKALKIFDDVLDYGVGYGLPFEIKGKIRFDRVHPRTLLMNEPDYGVPDEWYRFLDVPKRQVVAQFPDFENEIMRSGTMDTERGNDMQAIESGWTTIAESWFTPQDLAGRHCIVCGDAALVDDEWQSASPGAVPNRFFEPSEGFVGDSLSDLLGDIQDEISYLLERIQDTMDIGGTLKLLVDGGAGVQIETLSNELIQVIKHNGTKGNPAQILAIPAIDPVYFQQLDRLEGKAFSLVGLSELWAQSEKPAGLNSGAALQEMNDTTSARFLDVAQYQDSWYVELARSCIALSSSIPGFKVPINGEFVAWQDIELDEDEYDLTIAPVSLIPDSAPGVIQRILDDAQLDANLAADQLVLLDSLDHEAYVRQLIAPKLAVEKLLDEAFYDHKASKFNKKLDLAYFDRKAVLYWNQAYLKDDDVAMELIEKLQAKSAEAQGLMEAPMPTEEAPMESGGPMPMGEGMPPPEAMGPGPGGPMPPPGMPAGGPAQMM